MILALALPQFGESSNQALIVRWLKKEGDDVAEQEPLVEMETEKAVFSYECPVRGRLVKILEQESSQVAVGAEIAQFEVSEEDGRRYLSLGVGRAMGAGVVPDSSALSPLIRSLAKEHGLSLAEVAKMKGTGPGGRLTKEDFLRQVEGKKVPHEATAREGVRVIQLSPIRGRIADNMALSRQKIPDAGVSVEVDLSVIENWRKGEAHPPGYLPFAILAALGALVKYPVINSSLKEVEGRRWIEQYDYVHLGLAVATDHGLMVPVIHNAHRLSFRELSQEIERIVTEGRKGTLHVEELTGGTFTINNTGALGAIRSQQIIPPPQAAILAINRVVRRPWVVGDRIEIRPIMGLDIAFDHRIIDGDVATRFLMEVARNLEGFDTGRIS